MKDRDMNPIIQEILEKGFQLLVEYNPKTKKNEYIIGGFYKSDTVRLIEDDEYLDQFIAVARYNERMSINNFDDLIHLNHVWWVSSKDKLTEWASPNSKWLPFLIEKGLVKKEIKYSFKSTIFNTF
jgi:hypothetical protein